MLNKLAKQKKEKRDLNIKFETWLYSFRVVIAINQMPTLVVEYCIMRIGIVCYPTFGGSGVLATELGKALAQKGHQVHFITYQQPVRLTGFIPNIFYHEVQVPTYPLFDYPPYETALASTMVDVIKNNNLQLLHVHYAIPHASAAYMAKKILEGEGIHIPVITTLHGTDITLVGRFVTLVANGKTVICNQRIPGITGGALDSHEGEPGPLYIQGDHGPWLPSRFPGGHFLRQG